LPLSFDKDLMLQCSKDRSYDINLLIRLTKSSVCRHLLNIDSQEAIVHYSEYSRSFDLGWKCIVALAALLLVTIQNIPTEKDITLMFAFFFW